MYLMIYKCKVAREYRFENLRIFHILNYLSYPNYTKWSVQEIVMKWSISGSLMTLLLAANVIE